MKRFLIGLSGVLFMAGIVLAAGCAESLNVTGICIGLGCMTLSAIISQCLEKAGVLEEGDDDAED